MKSEIFKTWWKLVENIANSLEDLEYKWARKKMNICLRDVIKFIFSVSLQSHFFYRRRNNVQNASYAPHWVFSFFPMYKRKELNENKWWQLQGCQWVLKFTFEGQAFLLFTSLRLSHFVSPFFSLFFAQTPLIFLLSMLLVACRWTSQSTQVI